MMEEMAVEMVINILSELLFAVVVYEYFKIFFEKKTIHGTVVYIFLLNFFVNLIQEHISGYPDYCKIITAFAVLIGSSFFFFGRLVERIVYTLLFTAIGMLDELLVACIFVTYNISILTYNEIGFCITYSVLLLFIKVLQYFFRNTMHGMLSWQTNLKLMLVPMGSIFLAYRIFYSQYELGITGFYWKTMLSIIILLAINVMMFNIFVQLSENLELREKTAIYEKEFNLLEQHMNEREKLMEEFRRKRHDLKHQMLNLLSLLHNKEYEKLKADIEQLAEMESFEGLFLVHTENSIIDAFLNNKYATASEKGISFRTDLDIPVELPYAGEDLCVILGNALDNAIEACMRGNVTDPYIFLQMIYDGENLIIVVENTFDGTVKKGKKGNWATRKEDIQHHGIGIYSIKNTIQKYNGYYHVEIKDKVYRLELILYS